MSVFLGQPVALQGLLLDPGGTKKGVGSNQGSSAALRDPAFLRVTFRHMTSTPTKADLAAQVDQLSQQIAELTERLTAAERVQLRQIVWLQGDDARRTGTTAGGQKWAAFSFQYASRKEGEPRRYGAYKDGIAYGELAEALVAAYDAGDHLVAITAYERPAAPKEGEKRRFSDWVITSLEVVPRAERTAEPEEGDTEPQGYGEPSDEEVPF
jgi:hypothetical protein